MVRVGSEFEILAEKILKQLSDLKGEKNNITRNATVEGPDGIREIDILIESSICGVKIKTIIECKDYSRNVSLEKFEGFLEKMKDVKANKGIFITGKGFSKNVLSKASRNGIECYTIHEANHEKFNITLSIPCLIEKIDSINFNCDFKGSFERGDQIKAPRIINNINIHERFKNNYQNGLYDNLLFGSGDESILNIEIPISTLLETPGKYIINNTKGQEREIKDIKFIINVNKVYGIIYLNELRDTKIINDIIHKNSTIIFSLDEISNNVIQDNIRFYKKKEDITINGNLNLFIKLSPELLNFNITNLYMERISD